MIKANTFAFISSPYAAIFNEVKDSNLALEIALKIAQYGSMVALDKGYIPFSPVIAFNGIYEEKHRDEIMEKCYEAIKQSSLFLSVLTEYSEQSKGMDYELKTAYCFEIPVEFVRFEQHCFKYFPTPNEAALTNMNQWLETLPKTSNGGVKCKSR